MAFISPLFSCANERSAVAQGSYQKYSFLVSLALLEMGKRPA